MMDPNESEERNSKLQNTFLKFDIFHMKNIYLSTEGLVDCICYDYLNLSSLPLYFLTEVWSKLSLQCCLN